METELKDQVWGFFASTLDRVLEATGFSEYNKIEVEVEAFFKTIYPKIRDIEKERRKEFVQELELVKVLTFSIFTLYPEDWSQDEIKKWKGKFCDRR